MWIYPLFYGLIYYAVAIPVLLLSKDYKSLTDCRFYLKSLLFILLYGLSVGYSGLKNFEFSTLTPQERLFILLVLSRLKNAVFFIIPIYLLKKSVDKTIDGVYGLSQNTKHLKAYFLLFLMLFPFLIAISFTPDFLNAYPQFRPWNFDGIFGLPTWVYTVVYEISYIVDFVATELLFRGMLVIGMMSIMGRKAVLPMVAMYAAIHFGKPCVETLSSIFGGYILGALAYQTRHIWGGVMVHIFIALTMELMGFLGYYLLRN